MTLSGGWRGRGAHDIDGTSSRAREKRETKRTTRDREEQLEVRGAFCSAFLVRARAYSVVTSAPACTGRGAGGGTPPLETLFFREKQTVAWRDKVRFLGIAEKHVVRGLLCKQKIFGAPAELKECEEVTIFCPSILCP